MACLNHFDHLLTCRLTLFISSSALCRGHSPLFKFSNNIIRLRLDYFLIFHLMVLQCVSRTRKSSREERRFRMLVHARSVAVSLRLLFVKCSSVLLTITAAAPFNALTTAALTTTVVRFLLQYLGD